MRTVPRPVRLSSVALTLVVMLGGVERAAAADDFWQLSGIDELYQTPQNWLDGTPAGSGDRIVFDFGGVFSVLWDPATGNTDSDGIALSFGEVSLINVDLPGTHSHTSTGDILIDFQGTLRLDNLEVYNAFTGISVNVGREESGALHVSSGSVLTTAATHVGADVNLNGFTGYVSVDSGGTLNSDHLSVGSNQTGLGYGTGQVDATSGGALNAASISVAEHSSVAITDAGTTAAFNFLTMYDGSYVRFDAAAVATAGGADSSITLNGGTLDVFGGAQLVNLQAIVTQGGSFGGPFPSGDSFINIDGMGTVVELSAQSATFFTGVSLGFGGSATMNVTGGAVVDIGESAMAGVPSGFAVGQDLPDEFGGPTFGSSFLEVSGAGSELNVTGSHIQGSVGSFGAAANYFGQLGLPIANFPDSHGSLFVTGGGRVTLNETPGGTSRLVVADHGNSTGHILVQGTDSLLDAGQSLDLGSPPTAFGQQTVEVSFGGTLIADRVFAGGSATVTVSGAGSRLQFGGLNHGVQGGSVALNDSDFTLTNGATLDGQGSEALFSLAGGIARISGGAQVVNVQHIILQGNEFTPATLDISGAGTLVDLTAQGPANGTGLLIGFGNDATATIRGGATVNVGDSGIAGVSGGFTVGSNLPMALSGGQVPYAATSRLNVEGPNSVLHVAGALVGGYVGSATPYVEFFENVFGIPNVDDPGGNGTLSVRNGARVLLEETAGGSSALVVADTAGTVGRVEVYGGNALLDAGQDFYLGTDDLGGSGGLGTLDVYDGGEVVADRLHIGASASANLWGGTLTVGDILGATENFEFGNGVLNYNNVAGMNIGVGELLGDAFTVDEFHELNVAHDLFVDGNALLELAANKLGAARLVNNGDVLVDAVRTATGVGVLENHGRVVGDGQVDTRLENMATGEIRATHGDTLRFTRAGNTNDGEINLVEGSVEFSQDLTNNAGGFIGGRGIFEAGGGLDNQGVAAFTGVTDVFGDVANNGAGRFIVSGNTVLTFFDDVVHNGLEIRATPGSSIVFLGSLTGGGPYTGGGSFFIEGDAKPGNSPGLMSFVGDVTFGILNDSIMEIGGLTRATGVPGIDEYDAFDVTGTLTFGGDLTIELVDLGSGLFVPALNDVFNLFDAGTIGGTFANVFLPGLEAGLVWDTSALYTLGELSVAAVPLPGAVWMLLSAVLGLGLVSRRRQSTGA